METISRYRGYIILSLVFATLFGGYVFYERLPEPETIEIIEPTLEPTRTPGPIQVHVVGAVMRPGVYALPLDSRLFQAVEAAGGMTQEADESRINLADRVRDGQQVLVPARGATVPPGPTPLASGASTVTSQGNHARGSRININVASVPELESLPGIGAVYAQRIVAYRQESGPFRQTADIMNVKGIGPACYERIKERITID